MSRGKADAGLDAVRRVREARELDSRQGLQQANTELRTAQAHLDGLTGALTDDRPAGTVTTYGDFLAVRTALTALSGRISDARDGLDLSRTIADASLVHWQADHARVAAVEHLLEARAAQRRQDRRRREARELDDVAAQRWLRSRDEAGGAS